MKTIKLIMVLLIASASLAMYYCKKDDNEKTGFNIFSVADDVSMGQKMKAEIESKPSEYPILSKASYPLAYRHLERIRDSILKSDLIGFKDQFAYEVYIIHDDNNVNAFATPGGYLYFYTGLIKFLDNEAEFAGVMAHELAHAARRHSTEQLTKAYGLEMLLSIVVGENSSTLTEIVAGMASGLTTLAFSRSAENEADEYAVKYLYPSSYQANSLDQFFKKLEGAATPPTFLSTHPSPENRYQNIESIWSGLGGKNGNLYSSEYQSFKNSLP